MLYQGVELLLLGLQNPEEALRGKLRVEQDGGVLCLAECGTGQVVQLGDRTVLAAIRFALGQDKILAAGVRGTSSFWP